MEKQKAMDIYDVANGVDGELSYLLETADAMDMLYESLESEGYQSEERFEDCKAISFAHRFPAYLSTMNVLRRALRQNIRDIQDEVDKGFQAYSEQKEAQV